MGVGGEGGWVVGVITTTTPLIRKIAHPPSQRRDTRFVFLPGVGHCPHDDAGDLVNAELLPFLAAAFGGSGSGSVGGSAA